jgi:hypothetical protein
MLFSTVELSAALNTHERRIHRAITFDGLEILPSERDTLADEMIARSWIDYISLDTDNMYAEVVDRFVYISIGYPEEPPFIFPGDPRFVEHYPTGLGTRILPDNLEEYLDGNKIVLKIDTTGMEYSDLQSLIDDHLVTLNDIVNQMNGEIETFNDNMADYIRDLIDAKIDTSAETESLLRRAKPDMPIKRGKGKGKT